MSTGSTFKAIGKKVLSSCEAPLYSHEAQSRIACQINGIDDCLRSSRKLLSTLDDLVKSQFMEIFSECLGDKVSLSDVVWFQEGPGVRNYQYTAHGVKLLNVANLHDGELDISNTGRYISEEEAYGRYRHFLVEEGDLIIASSGIKVDYFDQKMGFAKKEQLPLCMNTSTIRFRAIDSRLNMIFFMYYLKSDDFKQQLARQITGSAQLNFGPSHLKKMSVPMPPFVLQQQFADFVAQVDKLGFDSCGDAFSACRLLLVKGLAGGVQDGEGPSRRGSVHKDEGGQITTGQTWRETRQSHLNVHCAGADAGAVVEVRGRCGSASPATSLASLASRIVKSST